MADTTDIFEKRNRARIVAVVLIATINYMIAIALAAVAIVVSLVLAAIFGLEVFPDDLDTLKWLGIGIGVIAAASFVIGLVVAVFKIPFARRSLERRVLRETGARVSQPPGKDPAATGPDDQREVRNLLEGLAIAGGIPVPRFAVIEDPAPNSFGVGTRPSNTIVGVTTGLSEKLSRDELEAVLAYEVSRIKGWDVALASWTVALTSGAISALDGGDDLVKGIIGYLPRRLGEWLQVWALRDQGAERDRAAVRFTRNPKSLLHALEKLDADSSQIKRVSRATAPLWVEFPAHVVAASSSRSAQRLGRELLLDERIEQLRALAGEAPPKADAAATP